MSLTIQLSSLISIGWPAENVKNGGISISDMFFSTCKWELLKRIYSSGIYQGHIKFFLSVIHKDIRKMSVGYTD